MGGCTRRSRFTGGRCLFYASYSVPPRKKASIFLGCLATTPRNIACYGGARRHEGGVWQRCRET